MDFFDVTIHILLRVLLYKKMEGDVIFTSCSLISPIYNMMIDDFFF